VQVTHQRSGFGPEKWFGSGSEQSKNLTHIIFVGESRTRTRQPARFAGFGKTCQFQSPVIVFGFFYLWSQSDILLLCAKYGLWYIIAFICFIGCLYNQNKERHASCYILKLSAQDFSSCIISKI
jgi:hypothetical protein